MIAWRIGDYRFGGTTIAAAFFLSMVVIGIVLSVRWFIRHRRQSP